MKKNFLKYCLFIIAVIFIMGACNNPIFYTISQEVAPIEPLIGGGPTNFVIYQNEMYVASLRKLWKYGAAGGQGRYGRWRDDTPQPGGNFQQLASTGNYLYAITYSNDTVHSLKRFNSTEWVPIPIDDIGSYDKVQYIFAAVDVLFIGAADGNSYTILYIDDTTEIYELALEGDSDASYEICGAAHNGEYYFICTKREGIYYTSDPSAGAKFIEGSKASFAGMISIGGGKIIAITNSGELFSVTSDIVGQIPGIHFSGRQATGALAIWIDPNEPDPDNPENILLLAGRQEMLDYSTSSGYTYGYLELELDLSQPNGIKEGTEFREPGIISVSSITDGNNERFSSTIGKHPVNHMFQAPKNIDSEMILFASTQKNGVWSYRNRNNELQWNGED